MHVIDAERLMVLGDEKGTYLLVHDIRLKCDDSMVRLVNAPRNDARLVGVIRIGDVLVDSAYHRGLDTEWVDRRDFDSLLVGMPALNRRPDGTYAVLEGLRRLVLAARNDVERLVCLVHQVPVDQEARYYEMLQAQGD